jgi:hypothetical protein
MAEWTERAELLFKKEGLEKISTGVEDILSHISKARIADIKSQRRIEKLERKIKGEKRSKMKYELDDFARAAQRLSTLFNTNYEQILIELASIPEEELNRFKQKVEKELKDYKKVVAGYVDYINGITSGAKGTITAKEVKSQAVSTLKPFFQYYEVYLNLFLKSLKTKIEKDKKIFLSIDQTTKNDKFLTVIDFNPSLYNGQYQEQDYKTKISAINNFFKYYNQFKISAEDPIESIKLLQERFMQSQKDMELFLTFVDEDIQGGKKISRSAADISAVQVNDSYQTVIKSQAFLVENIETGYKKVQIFKPSKLNIINDIKSKYEIK